MSTYTDSGTASARCFIVPPYLLDHIANLNNPRLEHASNAAQRALASGPPFRSVRSGEPAPPQQTMRSSGEAATQQAEPGSPFRIISDAENTETLPGRLVRSEGEPPTDDESVTEAYDGLGDTYSLFWEAFTRDSIDGNGIPLAATVHYGEAYDNAFWDGTQMVFGDGDGQIFVGFTNSLSVIGHELAHGVTQYTANLVYQGQPGALNESVSDVFGALVEQHSQGQSATEASWLIGEGIFSDEVEGQALRSMKAPGTAYDDDVLGKDPQPADMSGYIETDDDNGGVHLNSGIPNRAFYLAATAIGGNAWEAPGQIWYETLTSEIKANTNFEQFADATITVASRLFGNESREAEAVRSAWQTVGVTAQPE